MDPAWEYFVDGFFACADAFRQERGEDPAAVCLPTWSLHAISRVPSLHAGLAWPSKGQRNPMTMFGLPVVAFGDGFEFYGRDDERAQPWQDRLPESWPWTSVPPEALVGLVEGPSPPVRPPLLP